MRLNKKLWMIVGGLILLELIALAIVLGVNGKKQKQLEQEMAALTGNATNIHVNGNVAENAENNNIEEQEKEVSPFYFTPYNGYMDECTGWLYYDRFVNKDYNGDGKFDRVYREEVIGTKIDEESRYRIELSSGENLLVEKMSNGLPKIESMDIDGDEELEILFTCSFDYSHKADYIGLDVMLFDKVNGKYEKVELPFDKDVNKYYVPFSCENFSDEYISIAYQVKGQEKGLGILDKTEENKKYIGKKEKGKLYRISNYENGMMFSFQSFYDSLGEVVVEASYKNGEWKILAYHYFEPYQH